MARLTLVLGSTARCPRCEKPMRVEVNGLLKSWLVSKAMDRLEREGGIVTCACGHEYVVEPV